MAGDAHEVLHAIAKQSCCEVESAKLKSQKSLRVLSADSSCLCCLLSSKPQRNEGGVPGRESLRCAGRVTLPSYRGVAVAWKGSGCVGISHIPVAALAKER